MSIQDQQRRFYRDLHRQHGDAPEAVSYRDRETQQERFARLSRMFPADAGFTVHEIGCGLGDFGDWLARRHPRAVYSGSDITPEFVGHCRRRFPDGEFFERDVCRQLPVDRYDFVTQSGTFNPRLDASPEEWREFIESMLTAMYAMATRGIASNFLTTYNDPDRTAAHLHYQDQAKLCDFVVDRLSRHYEIDAAGPLFEFTLRVHRPAVVRQAYAGEPFARYFRPRDA